MRKRFGYICPGQNSQQRKETFIVDLPDFDAWQNNNWGVLEWKSEYPKELDSFIHMIYLLSLIHLHTPHEGRIDL